MDGVLDAAAPAGVRVLDTDAALHGLEPEWSALWAETPGATPFQHPAWLLPWWDTFGTAAPRVAIQRDAGRLRAVFPAYVLPGDHPGAAGGAKLLPIGAGTTDMLDALGPDPSRLLAALLDRCAADRLDCADLIDVPPASRLPAVRPPPGWTVAWHPGAPCPVLELGHIPAAIRRKLRMSRNRADRIGGWSVADAGPDGFDTLVGLHQSRWTAADQPGVLADHAVLRCLRLALPLLQAAGLLRLTVLRVGGAPAAAILALLAPGRIFFYLSGYDAAQAFVSPGTILLGAMLDQALAEGRTEAHFLRGQEPYKYAWGASDRLNRNGAFRRSNPATP